MAELISIIVYVNKCDCINPVHKSRCLNDGLMLG